MERLAQAGGPLQIWDGDRFYLVPAAALLDALTTPTKETR